MKTAKEIMTREPACTTREETLNKVAKKLERYDCGELPVVDDLVNLVPMGVITDRDIVVRVVARDKNPVETPVSLAMSTPCITVRTHTSIEECMRVMEEAKVRRVPVVDGDGRLVGIVAQADIARVVSEEESGHVLKQVSAA